MAQNSNEKRIFLIVSADPQRLQACEGLVKKHVQNAVIYVASDGAAAAAKFRNDKPHVLLTDYNLPKLNGPNLIDGLLTDRANAALAIVILENLPEAEVYLDQLVTGQVQFSGNLEDESEFTQCLYKALNYASHEKKAEFYLRYLAKNQTLLREGTRGEFVYLVKKGRLQAYKTTKTGKLNLGIIDVGEFVGEMAYVNGEPRSASVEALTDCELIEIPFGTLEKVLYSRPAWSKKLLLTLTQRLKQANEQRAVVSK